MVEKTALRDELVAMLEDLRCELGIGGDLGNAVDAILAYLPFEDGLAALRREESYSSIYDDPDRD